MNFAFWAVHPIWAALHPPPPLILCYHLLFVFLIAYVCVTACLPSRLWALWGRRLHLFCSLYIHCLVYSTYLLKNDLGGSQFPVYVADQTCSWNRTFLAVYFPMSFYLLVQGWFGRWICNLYAHIMQNILTDLSASFYWRYKALC